MAEGSLNLAPAVGPSAAAAPVPAGPSGRARLSERARLLPLAAVHINEKVGMLAKSGIHTLGELVDRSPKDLARLPGIGRRAVEHFAERLGQIDRSVDERGEIDWNRFCEAADLPVLPSVLPRTGAEFLAALPALVRELAEVLREPLEQAILFDRLTQPREQQRTLEELAGTSPVPMTRERVRQREKRLLDDISDALLFDEYPDLPLRFDASFGAFWKAAMDQLPAAGEMTFEAFCRCLCSCWHVSAEELFGHLPLVTVVLTSRAQIPPAMRATKGLGSASFGQLPQSILELPVRRLPLGRHLGQLEQANIHDVASLIDAFRYNRLGTLNRRLVDRAQELLGAMAGAALSNGTLDWQGYADRTGLELMPPVPLRGAEQFLAEMPGTITAVLRKSQITGRAADIFLARTCKPPAERPTLGATATALCTIGPTVKMEETRFLSALNSQLVEGDMSMAGVLYRPEYLDRWSEAAGLYRSAGGDYAHFRRMLAEQWQVSRGSLDVGIPILWAVIGRYPRGRGGQAGSRTSRPAAHNGATSNNVVVLRGFRRVH